MEGGAFKVKGWWGPLNPLSWFTWLVLRPFSEGYLVCCQAGGQKQSFLPSAGGTFCYTLKIPHTGYGNGLWECMVVNDSGRTPDAHLVTLDVGAGFYPLAHGFICFFSYLSLALNWATIGLLPILCLTARYL